MFLRTLLQLMALPTTKMNRKFQLVGYGATFKNPDGSRPTISCDGRIPNVTLELTHWNGNETPEDLYADTSTEMALKLAQNQDYAYQLKDAFVLNNHFDTDGVLSVWACLEPERALEYSDLLIQGAEAGDFGEWSSELGVKLDCTLTEMLAQSANNDESAYRRALEELPDILRDLQTTGGNSYKNLWGPGLENANRSWRNLERRDTALVAYNDDIVMMLKPSWMAPISPYALHRGLVEMDLDKSVKRILHSNVEAKSVQHFKYEKAGHGWVQKLIQRRPVPSVDADQLVLNLNNKFYGDDIWKVGGGGLISICYSSRSLSKPAEKVAEHLTMFDSGLQT